MNKAKVLVVDDSAFMRKIISDFLSEDGQFDVLSPARNGKDAIEKIKKYQPDVVTMDIEMPVLNGLDALRIIMKECPVPVVMLSSTTQEGAGNALAAMQYGAFDFCAKPSGSISLDLHKIKNELKEKVKEAAKANVTLLQKESLLDSNAFLENKIRGDGSHAPYCRNRNEKRIVLIGTSTGGPRALQAVLMKLPEDFEAPVLVVQHMPAGFTKSLAERLDSLCRLNVKEAEDGEEIRNGNIYIAPGDYHLQLKKAGSRLFVDLTQTDARQGHRPSVDVLFESASRLHDYSVIAVIMTGMGSDGTRGLSVLRGNRNVRCIAESEKTSIVFGMPRSAIAADLVDDVEDVENIAKSICKYC